MEKSVFSEDMLISLNRSKMGCERCHEQAAGMGGKIDIDQVDDRAVDRS